MLAKTVRSVIAKIEWKMLWVELNKSAEKNIFMFFQKYLVRH